MSHPDPVPRLRYPILLFLTLANLLTIVLVFVANSPALGLDGVFKAIPMYTAKFAPSLAAIVTIFLLAGRVGVARLLQPLGQWRRGTAWVLVAVLGPIALCALSLVVASRLNNTLLSVDGVSILFVAGAFVRPIVLGGGLGEEIGWRGLMFPLLQQRWGPIRASVVTGICWGLWHTPAFFVTGSGKSGGIATLALFTVLCVAYSCIFAWVFNASGGNLLALIVLHGCTNGALDAADLLYPTIKPDTVFALSQIAIAMALTIATRLGRPAIVPICEIENAK